MLFNSIDFLVFLPIVFILYWFVTNKSLNIQNLLLLSASYVFYGWWDYRFLALIVFSSFVDYLIGLKLHKTKIERKRKLLLFISIGVNLGFLGFFKYYNFFVDSFVDAFTFFGSEINSTRLNIILPVGISFYTFQTLSYSIDVYRKKLEPSNDIIAFFAYVSFFPQLVAGPIERAINLLPQFYKERQFNYDKAVDGLRQTLWGLFKKVVVADNCAVYVNETFLNYEDASGSTLLLGAILFAFQIYCDFSGYSDMAIGISRLFGFDLKRNFAFPYFSRDIGEFWRRWHISLSTWFRDYLYIPLGGSRGGTWKKVRNTFIIFLVSGFWHGANWTFIIWGGLNALYFLPLLLGGTNRKNLDTVGEGRILPNFRELIQMSITFFLTTIAWIFFRAESVTDALVYIKRLFTHRLFSIPKLEGDAVQYGVIFIILLIVVEWVQRNKEHGLELTKNTPFAIRWGIYFSLILIVFYFSGDNQEFIYFQF